LILARSGAAAGGPVAPTPGVALGATPTQVAAVLARDYPVCQPARSIYHAGGREKEETTAALSINPGLSSRDIGAADLCAFSPAGEGVSDSIEGRFLHPSLDTDQPLYWLRTHREFPDFAYGKTVKPPNSFEALRAELMRRYGRPVDERRTPTVSSAANLASSLGIGRQVRREDQLVRYLWAASGKLAEQEFEDTSCVCTGRYVKAVIEISRSPAAAPGNRYHVLSVTMTIEDPALRARQDAWNAQWQRAKD